MQTRLLSLLVLVAALGACRDSVSHKPPIHLVPDMDHQQKIKAQSEFHFPGWKDNRGMRMPVDGTVARGTLRTKSLERYQDASGQFIANPLPATAANFARGRERFDIYCAVCHDRAGSGKGMVLQRAQKGAFNAVMPDLATDERLRGLRDGELYQTIAEGKATMPAYAHMVQVEDRWRIVHYLRALQNRIKQ
jgi:mono/diheme cytochrome c family protein